MGIMSGLGKVKMFFTGKDGEMKEMNAEAVEVTYEPVNDENPVTDRIVELGTSYKEMSIEFENAEINLTKFNDMMSSLNEIIKNNKRDQKILSRTKNKRIAKKVYKRLHNL
ncbi:hypothetical protein AAXE64_07815 [Priestia megaterium]